MSPSTVATRPGCINHLVCVCPVGRVPYTPWERHRWLGSMPRLLRTVGNNRQCVFPISHHLLFLLLLQAERQRWLGSMSRLHREATDRAAEAERGQLRLGADMGAMRAELQVGWECGGRRPAVAWSGRSPLCTILGSRCNMLTWMGLRGGSSAIRSKVTSRSGVPC